MKKTKSFIIIISAIILMAGLSGCNFFNFLHKSAVTGTNAIDEHIAEGKKLLNLGLYADAELEFRYAIQIGTTSTPNDKVTDAYYYHAIAYSRNLGVDSLGIMLQMVTAIGSADSSEAVGLLEGFDLDVIRNINTASGVAKDDLWAIFTSSTDATFRQGEIRPENVYFDLTMCATLKAISSIVLLVDYVGSSYNDLMLTFDNGTIDWTDPDTFNNLTAEQKGAFVTAVQDSMGAANTVMDWLYPGQTNPVKTVVGDVSIFFDDKVY